MAYYMMCERRSGDYSLIDITKSNCFTRSSKLKNNGCELYEIDLFTSQFDDIDDLRNHLITFNLLSNSYASKPLSIRRKVGGKYKKVMYDFLYQKDIYYIAKPEAIIDTVCDKLYQKDFRFVQKFSDHYKEHKECSSTLPELRFYIGEAIRNGEICSGLSDVDENGDDLLRRTVKLLLYEYTQGEDGKVVYSKKIVYRNLHSLICFVNNYDNKFSLKQESTDNTVLTSSCLPKKRTRKIREEIPGQVSF